MNKILLAVFATTMKGTVDQIDTNRAIVEMLAKDGHTHEVEFPIWVFPCKVEEGTIIWIDMLQDRVTIRCNKEKKQ